MSVRPCRLKPGAVFGIAAPASPFDAERMQRGAAVLHALGFRTVPSPNLFAAAGHLAGSDAERAADLNRLFADPAVDAVICARGGYGSMRVLPLIDYARIAADPKPLVGFSDISALIAALDARCGLVAFHGPMLTTLADAGEPTRAALREALCREGTLAFDCEGAVTLRPGRAAAPVIGGNLTTLSHLLGTPFAPDFNGRIVFLEDCGEAPYRIDRMLSQFRLAGAFERAAGLLLGRFTDCGAPEEVLAVAADVVGGLGFPILAGLNAGHGEPNLTLPFGVPARLDAAGRTLEFDFPPAFE